MPRLVDGLARGDNRHSDIFGNDNVVGEQDLLGDPLDRLDSMELFLTQRFGYNYVSPGEQALPAGGRRKNKTKRKRRKSRKRRKKRTKKKALRRKRKKTRRKR